MDTVLSHETSGSSIHLKLLPRLTSSILRQSGTAEVKTVCHRPSDGEEAFDSASRIFYQATGMRYEISGDPCPSGVPTRPGLPYSNNAENDNLIQQLNKRLRKQQARFKRTSIKSVKNTKVALNCKSSHDLAHGISASSAAASMSELDIGIGFNHHVAGRLLANSKVSSLRKASITMYTEPHDTSYPTCSLPIFDKTLTARNLNVTSLNVPTMGAAPLSKPVPKPCQRSKQPAIFKQLPANLTDLTLAGYLDNMDNLVPVDLTPALRSSGTALQSLSLKGLQLQRQLPFSSLTNLETLKLSGLRFPPAPTPTPAAPQQPGQQNQNQQNQPPGQGQQNAQHAPAQHQPQPAPVQHNGQQENQPGQPPAAPQHGPPPAQQPAPPLKPKQQPEPLVYSIFINDIVWLQRLKHLHAPELCFKPQLLSELATKMPNLRTVVAGYMSITTNCPLAAVAHLSICSEFHPAATAAAPPQASSSATFRLAAKVPLAAFFQAQGLRSVFPEVETLAVTGAPLLQVLTAASGHPTIHTLITHGAPGLRGGAVAARLSLLPALRAVHLLSMAGSFGAHAAALLPSLVRGGAAVSELVLEVLPYVGLNGVSCPSVPQALLGLVTSADVAKQMTKLLLRGCHPLYEDEVKALLAALPVLKEVEAGVLARQSMGEAALEVWKDRVVREVFGGRGLVVVEAEARWERGHHFRAVAKGQSQA